jgi:hypothetical protein
MSDRTRNEKGQYSTGQETPESENAIPPPPETTGQTITQHERGPYKNTQSTALGVLQAETTAQTSPLSLVTADTRMAAQAALILASHEKSEVLIFLEGVLQQGILTRAHVTYMLDMYPIETRDDLSFITAIELRCAYPDGLWGKGDTPGPLTVKQTNLFLRSVVSYLHYEKESKVEVCETNADMGPQVLLLPTGKAVRFSPVMQKHSEDEARIEQEVERRGALRDASMQARWLEQNQGQVGYHAQHGEAMSKFPTRPDPNQRAYHAAMVEEAQRDTNSSTFSYDLSDNEGVTKFSYDMRGRHAAMVEEAQRDTNSSTFSYDLRDQEEAVHQATAPRSSWSFKDYKTGGYKTRYFGR